MESVEQEQGMEDELAEMEEALKRHTAPTKTDLVSGKTIQFYTNHIGEMSQHVRLELSGWVWQLSEVHVYEALKRAVENGNATWQYAKGILANWKPDGLDTMEAVVHAENTFRMQRGRRGVRQDVRPKEVIPDWFYESRRKRHGVG